MCRAGYKIYGVGAHEAEVAFSAKIGMKEAEVRMLDELRQFRNQMLYSGKILDREYAEQILILAKQAYPRLKISD